MIESTHQSRCLPIVFAFALLAPAANAGPCIDYSQTLQWISLTPTFSSIFELETEGNFAYLMTGPDFGKIKIYDLTNLESPTLLSTTDFSDISEIAVQDERMLIATYSREILSCDVSDPLDIKILDSLRISSGVRDFALRGDLAYVAIGNQEAQDGLYVLRISDQGELSIESFLSIPGFPHCLDVENGIAYVGTLSDELCAVDVSDPTNPLLLSCVEVFPYMDAYDLDVDGQFVYVADGLFGLRIFSASDPKNLVQVNQIPLVGSTPFEIKVDLGRLFIAPAGLGVQAYDLSLPDAPVLLGSIPGFSYPLSASAGKLFCTGFERFGISDASYWRFPTPLNQFISELPRELETSGRIAFALDYPPTAEQPGTLRTISFEDPQDPHVWSTIEIAGAHGQSMSWHPPHLYVGTRSNTSFGGSLLIFEYQEQVAPEYLGGLILGGPADDIAVDRQIAYTLVGFFGVRVIDVSSPESPILLGTWPAGFGVRCLEVLQEDRLLCSLDGQLSVMDVSTPTNPQVLVQIPELTDIRKIKVRNQRALVASDDGILTLLNVADPSNPIVLGSLQIYNNPKALAFNEAHAYVVHAGPVMSVVGLSDPNDLRWIGPMPIHSSEDIELADGILLTASVASGIYVLPLQCETFASGVNDADRIDRTPLWSPNPFQSSTSLAIDVKEESTIVLELFDVSGRRVAVKQSQILTPGVHHIRWNGCNEANQSASPGVYWSRIQLSDQILTSKLLKIR